MSAAPLPPPVPALRRVLPVLYLTVFLDLLGFGMIIPLLQLHARELHATAAETGWLVAVYSLMQLVFAPLWGRLSDRVGRRPVLLVSIFGSCLSQLGYALAPTWGLLVLARAAAGVCGANISAAQAYVADVTDDKSRAASLGTLGAVLGLGFIFGPFIGGELSRTSIKLPFFVASALSAVNFALAAWLVKEPPRHRPVHHLSRRTLLGVVGEHRLLNLMFLFFIVTFGFANMEGVFALFAADRFGYDKQQVGRLFGLVGAVMVIVQGRVVRKLVPLLGERRLVLCGIGLMGVGLGLMAEAHRVPALILGMVLLAMGSGLNSPSLSALVSRRAGAQQGWVLGVSQAVTALGRIIGPLVGTRTFEIGTGVPYWIAAGSMGLAFLMAYFGPGTRADEPRANV